MWDLAGVVERLRWLIGAPDNTQSARLYLYSHHIAVWQPSSLPKNILTFWRRRSEKDRPRRCVHTTTAPQWCFRLFNTHESVWTLQCTDMGLQQDALNDASTCFWANVTFLCVLRRRRSKHWIISRSGSEVLLLFLLPWGSLQVSNYFKGEFFFFFFFAKRAQRQLRHLVKSNVTSGVSVWAALQTMTHGCELVPCGLTQELKGITKSCTVPRVQLHLNTVCAVKIEGKKDLNRRHLTDAKPVFTAGVLICHSGKSTDVTHDNNGAEPEPVPDPDTEAAEQNSATRYYLHVCCFKIFPILGAVSNL